MKIILLFKINLNFSKFKQFNKFIIKKFNLFLIWAVIVNAFVKINNMTASQCFRQNKSYLSILL